LRSGLFINPFGIGDVLFTTPLLHTVKDAFPDIKLGYLCNRRVAPILENNPLIDSLFIYERDEFEAVRKKSFISWIEKNLSFLNRIKRERFDFAIDFSLNSQYGFYSWYAGIKRRIGYDFKGRGWFLTEKSRLTGYREKHVVDYYAGLLKFIGLALKFRSLELYLNQKDIDWADNFLSSSNVHPGDTLVGIVPGAGASWGREAFLKQWPVDNFACLADKIIENYKAKIIIMGDSADRIAASGILGCMHNPAIDAVGKASLGQFAALLSRMKLVITNDGGPMHMATALGVKVIAVFGPTDEAVYGPYPKGNNQIVVKKSLDCQPCYLGFRIPPCEHNKQCLILLVPDDVYTYVKRMLG